MLEIAFALFVIALISVFFGFGIVAGLAAGGALLFLFGFLTLVVVEVVGWDV